MAILNGLFEPYFFEEWLREKRNLADSTMSYYVSVITNFLYKYNEVSLNNINEYIIDHAIRNRQSAVYSILKAFVQYKFKDVGERNQIIENMIRPPIRHSAKQERAYLSEDEIVKVINNLKKPKHKIVGLIQDLTGVRAGDVMRIRRGNIIPEIYDGENVLKIVIYGKGDKRNVVYVHDTIGQELIINYIIKNRHSDDYYFMEFNERNKDKKFRDNSVFHSNYVSYYRDLKQSLARAGFEHKSFATHDYRRCYARRVWDKFKDLHVLQELLNHENPATTMRYLKHSGLKNIEYHKQMQG